MRKGGPAPANTLPKNTQKAGGGTEQKKKSCTPLKLLLLSTIDTILEAVDKRKLTGVIYVDMSKAFDNINHSIIFIAKTGSFQCGAVDIK